MNENKTQTVRYYSTQRPVAPGTFPKTQKVKDIVNFDRRQQIPEINHEAWGYIEYEAPLDADEANRYELIIG